MADQRLEIHFAGHVFVLAKRHGHNWSPSSASIRSTSGEPLDVVLDLARYDPSPMVVKYEDERVAMVDPEIRIK